MTVKDLLEKLKDCTDQNAEVFIQKDENSPSIVVKVVAVNNVKCRVRIIGKEHEAWKPSKSPLSLL